MFGGTILIHGAFWILLALAYRESAVKPPAALLMASLWILGLACTWKYALWPFWFPGLTLVGVVALYLSRIANDPVLSDPSSRE